MMTTLASGAAVYRYTYVLPARHGLTSTVRF